MGFWFSDDEPTIDVKTLVSSETRAASRCNDACSEMRLR